MPQNRLPCHGLTPQNVESDRWSSDARRCKTLGIGHGRAPSIWKQSMNGFAAVVAAAVDGLRATSAGLWPSLIDLWAWTPSPWLAYHLSVRRRRHWIHATVWERGASWGAPRIIWTSFDLWPHFFTDKKLKRIVLWFHSKYNDTHQPVLLHMLQF